MVYKQARKIGNKKFSTRGHFQEICGKVAPVYVEDLPLKTDFIPGINLGGKGGSCPISLSFHFL